MSITCEAHGSVLAEPVPAEDRRIIRMAAGDEALVFQLGLPAYARR